MAAFVLRSAPALLLSGMALASCVAASTTPRTGARASTPPGPALPMSPSACPPRDTMVRLDGVARQGGVLRGQLLRGGVALSLDGRAVPLTADRAFVIAFDRDAPATATLGVTLERGCGAFDVPLSVAPANWDIQSVNASITGGVSSAEFQARRAPELESIAAARARMTPGSSEGWRQAFVWPVVARISGRFGSQRIYRGTPGSYHSGVDLAAPAGTIYVAPADGVVILAASTPYTLEGNLLLIDHGMGLNSAFLHSQRLLVKAGEVVRRGQPIGMVGATGRATGPHLHWGMKWQDARIDPITLVDAADPPR
ncbi:M23 family metallopeptidase [Sphingobium sufflavum]|uniref:M23 family metallopeptidase n=1 Tax=Sphingobium sufflavum TaxID=1129547 RepID=UPI001F3EE5DD|nr:M23 family metallopeptidase [Sphingobium sufflavum]MCE7795947.1 M23 family metallopeptidase [Sphingobium sufflavum]